MSVATIVVTVTRAGAPSTAVINRGPTGDTGATGADGSDGAGLRWRNTWQDSTSYLVGDLVRGNGFWGWVYICTQNHDSTVTNAAGSGSDTYLFWDVFAQDGS